MSALREVLIGGQWRPADASGSFRAVDPTSGNEIEDAYPVSGRSDIDAALEAGARAADELRRLPAEVRAAFLERAAERIEARRAEICELAGRETALPVTPRLARVELPRATSQLRLAAAAARDGDWTSPVIDTAGAIRSMYAPLGAPVALVGPNNFPIAFNAVSGGDFAAAVAAGNPVIAKGHPSHPGTTRLLAEAVREAAEQGDVPPATLQLLYHFEPADGEHLVTHRLLGAVAFTGSRRSGLAIKAAADRVGKPVFLELGSVNPVFILPGALGERSEAILGEYVGSVLLGCGQFCTKPGLLVLPEGPAADAFVAGARKRFRAAEPGALLAPRVLEGLEDAVGALRAAGAELLEGGERVEGGELRYRNTLLGASASRVLDDPAALQREAFGNAALVVLAPTLEDMERIASVVEGSLTGTIYSDRGGADDAGYERIAFRLRPRVGRLLDDKMPTGVAVSPAMNHGGPFPATGHPGYTAVGIPASLRRFAALQCFDAVREHRLPPELRDRNPTGSLWRSIDGEWTTADVASPSR